MISNKNLHSFSEAVLTMNLRFLEKKKNEPDADEVNFSFDVYRNAST